MLKSQLQHQLQFKVVQSPTSSLFSSPNIPKKVTCLIYSSFLKTKQNKTTSLTKYWFLRDSPMSLKTVKCCKYNNHTQPLLTNKRGNLRCQNRSTHALILLILYHKISSETNPGLKRRCKYIPQQ